MYWAYTGEDPGVLEVGHTCHNRDCINPQHLYLCTHQENMAYAAAAGRMSAIRKRRISIEESREVMLRKIAGETWDEIRFSLPYVYSSNPALYQRAKFDHPDLWEVYIQKKNSKSK
jgi:hypothetical protein